MQLQFGFSETKIESETGFSKKNNNKIAPADGSFHKWYRFVLSFPPHLVRQYINKFKVDHTKVILDPFCGTGTTLVESKINNIATIGVEANPFAKFASSVKVDWNINSEELESTAKIIAKQTIESLRTSGIDDLTLFRGDIEELDISTIDEQSRKLLISNSISPLPLHKTLVLLKLLRQFDETPFYRHMVLALANALVFKISNLRFGPEVGVGKLKKDYPVVESWLCEIKNMSLDLKSVNHLSFPESSVKFGDAREISDFVEQNSVDAVITSPPYPNEKDYTRTTRLESVVLGFIKNIEELRTFKKSLIRSNTRGIYKNDNDEKWIANNDKIQNLAKTIEAKRIELGKTSGFEKLYHKVTLQYFGGMAKHLSDLRHVLKQGALLAYVVGDQASYLKIMIRTGELLAEIAESLGYELIDIDLFRTRFATATSSDLKEEVVLLRWPG